MVDVVSSSHIPSESQCHSEAVFHPGVVVITISEQIPFSSQMVVVKITTALVVSMVENISDVVVALAEVKSEIVVDSSSNDSLETGKVVLDEVSVSVSISE